MTDAELVARARRGETAAFGELVTRHRTAVFRAALAALGARADADDASQETFVQAYQQLDRFRGEASFRTWLLTIAWRRAVNRRRELGRWWRRPGPWGASENSAEAVANPGPSPEEMARAGELRREITRQIRALSPKLRDTLLLAQAGLYTYEDIAAMLGVSTGTVKWRVWEARRIIRKQLEERGYVDGR